VKRACPPTRNPANCGHPYFIEVKKKTLTSQIFRPRLVITSTLKRVCVNCEKLKGVMKMGGKSTVVTRENPHRRGNKRKKHDN
jgi:hypothetical protein